MKKLLIFTIAVFVALFTISYKTTNAEEKKAYFINMNGVELTEKQYNNLLNGFEHDTINTMTQDMIDIFKDDENIHMISTEKYIKTVTKYVNGVAVENKDFELSLEEYNKAPTKSEIVYEKSGAKSGNNDYVETNYKKIYLSVTQGAADVKSATLKTVWKTIPYIKSYDVLAIAPKTHNYILGPKTGYQKYDGNIINYTSSSGNWHTTDTSGDYGKGAGLSQNIVDSTTTSLENSITIMFESGADPFPVRASYQHATSYVSLSDSHSYTLGLNGMGDLIEFSSSVSGYYDDTPGLYVNYSVWNI